MTRSSPLDVFISWAPPVAAAIRCGAGRSKRPIRVGDQSRLDGSVLAKGQRVASVGGKMILRQTTCARTVSVADGLQYSLMVAKGSTSGLVRRGRIQRRNGSRLVAPHRGLMRRPDQLQRADDQNHRLVATLRHERLMKPAGVRHIP